MTNSATPPAMRCCGGPARCSTPKVILDLVAINNEFYTDLPLSLSMGIATSQPGERLEAVVKRADLAMLAAKREHYAQADEERRAGVA